MKMTIGWREWVALPELDVPAIKVKVDTGARTSALHACSIEPFMKEGQEYVRFRLNPLQRRTDIERLCEAPIRDRRVITDSGGHRERRYIIETRIGYRGVVWPIEVTLTNRSSMQFRMLLGRTAMAGRLIVDPAGSFLGGRHLGQIYQQESGK